MKTAEHATATASNRQTQPFFKKGGHDMFFDEQTSFFSAARPNIQTKLSVGQPNDIYEQEADDMADKVVQRSDQDDSVQSKTILQSTYKPFVQSKCTECEEEEKAQKKEEPGPEMDDEKLQRKPIFESLAEAHDDSENIQRKCTACEKEEKLQKKEASGSNQAAAPDIESRLNSTKGSGSPLHPDIQSRMETSFGADFSSVRIHNNSSAVQMSQDLHAQAFTHGNDIYFNSARYDTRGKSGQHLLSHELTHVVQQKPENKLFFKRKDKKKKIWDVNRPALSLYQDTGELDGKFFMIQANKKSSEIRSVKFDLSPECPINAEFGSIPYKTGHDIIEAIAKAYWCTGDQVSQVHIFGHSGSGGLYGADGSFSSEYGLYKETPSDIKDQKKGGSGVSEIPSEALGNTIVFVLHGCSTAAGDDSFAETLYKSIVGSSTRFKAKVYGHSMLGMCGRDKDWMEFSAKNPEGKNKKNPYALKNP